MSREYGSTGLTRAELDQTQGPVLVEFGTNWCGICKAAQPDISAALSEHAALEHIKVADASGQPLGRSFRVKLWPTLIALRDGKEVARLVRPTDREAVSQLLAQLDAGQTG